MGNRCRTCRHSKRAEIEEDILNSVPYRSISEKFKISHTSVRRHFENGHISQAMVKATELKGIAYSDDLLAKLKYMQNEAMKVLYQASNPIEGPPLLSVVLAAIGKAIDMIKVQGVLAGQLKENEIIIAINSHWVSIRQEIFQILESYPDARKAMTEGVASGKLSSIEKNMLEVGDSDPKHEVLSPAMLEVINATLGIDPEEEHPNKGYQERLDREAKVQGRKDQEMKPPVETKICYRCVADHFFHGRHWSVGQIWDSSDPDGPQPPVNDHRWQLHNPAEKVSRLLPTRRRNR